MLSVVLNAPDVLRQSAALLDKGFATPVASESISDQLPSVHIVMHQKLAATGTVLAGRRRVAPPAGLVSRSHHHRGGNGVLTWIADIIIGLAALVARPAGSSQAPHSGPPPGSRTSIGTRSEFAAL